MAMSILESYSFPRYWLLLMFRVLGTSVATMPCIQRFFAVHPSIYASNFILCWLDPQFCELSPLLCVRTNTCFRSHLLRNVPSLFKVSLPRKTLCRRYSVPEILQKKHEVLAIFIPWDGGFNISFLSRPTGSHWYVLNLS